MTLTELNDSYGIPGVLTFAEKEGLTRAEVKTPACEAIVYFHGAHLAHWQPAGQKPVLYLSQASEYAPAKAIRGGIPVCFPWFGPRSQGLGSGGKGSGGGAHGFARTAEWTLAFAALSGDDLHLTFTLTESDASQALGFDHFSVAYELILGKTLDLRFTVANTGDEPFHYEAALHTYFAVEDVRKTTIKGLESAPYLDKTDGNKEKHLPDAPLTLTGWTDWVFPQNSVETIISKAESDVLVTKKHSNTTVVWNPWEGKAAAMADISPGSWTEFLCLEAANSGVDAIVLAPQQTHTMQALIAVQAL
jgi:glucose-6-phosphate 1-epimerase